MNPETVAAPSRQLTPFLLRGGRFYPDENGKCPDQGRTGFATLRHVGEMRRVMSRALEAGEIAGSDARAEMETLDQMRMTLKGMGATLNDGRVAVLMGPLFPRKSEIKSRKAKRKRVKDSRRKNRKPKKRRR